MIYFFNVGRTVCYQNEHNMLMNFPRCLSILLLQTSKTDNNALDITRFITSNLEKHNLIQHTALLPN
jgi:hypothetical protein